MQIFSHPLPLIFFCVLAALHFVSGALPPLIEKITRYVNIFLHIVFFFVLMLYKVEQEEVAFLYLLSLLFYLLAFLFWNVLCVSERAEDKENGGEDAV